MSEQNQVSVNSAADAQSLLNAMLGFTHVPRAQTWKAFEMEWCPKCGCKTSMEKIVTNLPGIFAQRCDCGACYEANYLESGDDMMRVPEEFTWPNVEVSGCLPKDKQGNAC